MTIAHDALDLTIEEPPGPAPLCTGTLQLPILISDGKDWRPVQTCSLEDPVLTSGRWLLKYIHTVGERAVCILMKCFLV